MTLNILFGKLKPYGLAVILTEVIFDTETLLGQEKNCKIVDGSEINFEIDSLITSITCVGKQLFITVDSGEIFRLHFGMNGGLRFKAKKFPPPTFTIYCEKENIYFYETTLKKISSTVFDAQMKLSNRDVLSDVSTLCNDFQVCSEVLVRSSITD